MISRQNPEYWRYRYRKRDSYNDLYRQRLITETTYLLLMEMAGFSPREARDELALLKRRVEGLNLEPFVLVDYN
jgi:hypothetical protein